ncbi:hypothetical protein [Mesorhizobium silamurunense]|uniref:hypothetical protein n=1 Tax=Mesorhizobium silamurunense TaxID=499528 RepID=UPI001784C785|nr:hypothetical protein [Mesorhizobium silamurunense]
MAAMTSLGMSLRLSLPASQHGLAGDQPGIASRQHMGYVIDEIGPADGLHGERRGDDLGSGMKQVNDAVHMQVFSVVKRQVFMRKSQISQ